MINGNLRRAFPYRLILSILMGVVLLYLAANFVTQTGERLDLRDRLRHIEQEIAATEKANSELKARLDYVSSDDAAETWARENGWARSDAPIPDRQSGCRSPPRRHCRPDGCSDREYPDQ